MNSPKLKVGDTFPYTKEMDEAKIKQKDCNASFSDSIGDKAVITRVNSYRYDTNIAGVLDFASVDPYLPPTEITWETLKLGDVLIDEDGLEVSILGILGKIIFLSEFNDRESTGNFYTIQECQKDGWKIVQPEPTKPTIEELTMDQVCKELGREVKIKK